MNVSKDYARTDTRRVGFQPGMQEVARSIIVQSLSKESQILST